MDKLEKQLGFVHELDRLKAVYRQTFIKSENNRRENSAEHSWHAALMAHVLVEHVVEPVNLQRVILMLLIHDVVEIDAGDVFAFADAEAIAHQAEKELNAANRLFGLLPNVQFDELKSLWIEFEEAKTPDARYANAIDCLLPVMQNMANEGGTWSRRAVTKAQVVARNSELETLSPALWTYFTEQVRIAEEKGWLS
ncbi:HD domain-containing protein [Thaumasiovibrio subtropicus]|uniref:HD domain-containing protein n=1 Tax=Thaumasiovibrio subtropicus TaxID=1891207 RepID=UPI000B356AAE|nr:HD domain-containing protein [Thaumasiovibrio subtropicus]